MNIIRKVSFVLLFSLLFLTGCGKAQQESKQEEYKESSLGDVIFLEDETGKISIDLTQNETIKGNYDELMAVLEGVDKDKIVAINTYVGNILYGMGITPYGVTNSSYLDTELQARRGKVESIVDGKIIYNSESNVSADQVITEIGGFIPAQVNKEVIVALQPDLVLGADVQLDKNGDLDSLKSITKIHFNKQKTYYDIFVMIQAFEDTYDIDEHTQALFKKFRSDVDQINVLLEKNKDNFGKKVAILQFGRTKLYTKNHTYSVSKLAELAGLDNIYLNEENIEMSAEKLILDDPEYLLFFQYTGTKEEAVNKLVTDFGDETNPLSKLSAIKDKKILVTPFNGYSDLTFTENLLNLIVDVYDE